ncbi:bifunctional DNA primase/polymerase [Streptomyces sp. NPDC008343]|uniref:bifunctional DNA primase/polymerase n=1 Tax=Streptomyces sp. NPDC008343 TaxID=3364828 RepID=UPI0036ED534C
MVDPTPTGAALRARLLDTALTAARRGWPVLPLRPGTGLPALSGDDPAGSERSWEARATTDLERVRRVWSSDAFNVGITPGPAGLVVVAIDAAADGATSFRKLCRSHGEPVPTTRTVRTWDGSTHLYFTSPAAIRFPSTFERLAPGVNTHAWGTYVVASGSVIDGRPVVAGVLPFTTVGPALINPLPGWLTLALRSLR